MDIQDTEGVEDAVEAAVHATVSSISIWGSGRNCQAVTWEMVVNESAIDPEISQLVELVRKGIRTAETYGHKIYQIISELEMNYVKRMELLPTRKKCSFHIIYVEKY